MRGIFQTLLIVASLGAVAVGSGILPRISVANAQTGSNLEQRIVPVIKPRAWLHQMQKDIKAAGSNQELLVETFSDDLVVAYAEDMEKRLRYLMTNEFTGNRTQLRALAVDNLQRAVPKFDRMIVDDEVSIISAGDDYTSGLVLSDRLWSGGHFKIPGELVVAIPTRDAIVVTGSRGKTLKNVRQLTADLYAQGPYSLSDKLFVYRNKQFVPFRGGL
jgi:uncharacterized protein YtpQ (UPF0354 family)